METDILSGKLIEDVRDRSCDADCMLEDATESPSLTDPLLDVTEWREVSLPISAFGHTYDRATELRGCDHAEEDERDQRIRDWVKEEGGWEKALFISPVVAVYVVGDKGFGKLVGIDGWHREKLAKEAGQTHVLAVVGIVYPKFVEPYPWREGDELEVFERRQWCYYAKVWNEHGAATATRLVSEGGYAYHPKGKYRVVRLGKKEVYPCTN